MISNVNAAGSGYPPPAATVPSGNDSAIVPIVVIGATVLAGGAALIYAHKQPGKASADRTSLTPLAEEAARTITPPTAMDQKPGELDSRTLCAQEIEALRDYKSDYKVHQPDLLHGSLINYALRYSDGDTNIHEEHVKNIERLQKPLQERVRTIDRVLQKSASPEIVRTTHRGVPAKFFFKPDGTPREKFQVGKIYTDSAYLSTNAITKESFEARQGYIHNNVLIEVHGHSGVNLKELTGREKNYCGDFEDEVLYPRSTPFRIKSIGLFDRNTLGSKEMSKQDIHAKGIIPKYKIVLEEIPKRV